MILDLFGHLTYFLLSFSGVVVAVCHLPGTYNTGKCTLQSFLFFLARNMLVTFETSKPWNWLSLVNETPEIRNIKIYTLMVRTSSTSFPGIAPLPWEESTWLNQLVSFVPFVGGTQKKVRNWTGPNDSEREIVLACRFCQKVVFILGPTFMEAPK